MSADDIPCGDPTAADFAWVSAQAEDADERPAIDRKAEHEFHRARPTKNIPCIAPGCAKKFRPSTAYRDFLCHWQDKHAAGK